MNVDLEGICCIIVVKSADESPITLNYCFRMIKRKK